MGNKIFELEYKNILYIFELCTLSKFERLLIKSNRKINDDINNVYLCQLSLYDINGKGGIFKECKSIKESLDLFLDLFSSKNFEIKKVNKYKNIIIGIKDNKKDILLNEKKILFQLDYCSLSYYQRIKIIDKEDSFLSTKQCLGYPFDKISESTDSSFLMNISRPSEKSEKNPGCLS